MGHNIVGVMTRRSTCEDQALGFFHWDSVPNPDTPCGLYVLHVFAKANTRTRPVV